MPVSLNYLFGLAPLYKIETAIDSHGVFFKFPTWVPNGHTVIGVIPHLQLWIQCYHLWFYRDPDVHIMMSPFTMYDVRVHDVTGLPQKFIWQYSFGEGK